QARAPAPPARAAAVRLRGGRYAAFAGSRDIRPATGPPPRRRCPHGYGRPARRLPDLPGQAGCLSVPDHGSFCAPLPPPSSHLTTLTSLLPPSPSLLTPGGPVSLHWG